MSSRRFRAHLGKILLLLFWGACILAIYWFLDAYNIPLRRLPIWMREEVFRAGGWGPFYLFFSYVAVTIIPFPTAALAFVAGTIYGPVYGSLLVLFSLNVASAFSFYLGRYFGRHFFHEHEHGLIKKYDDLMRENGFMTVLLMRIIFVPFDVVSIGSGMSKITFREYLVASFLGSAPGTITLVVLGNTFTHPRSWLLFGFTLSLSLVFAVLIRHSAWAKRHLFKKVEPNNFE